MRIAYVVYGEILAPVVASQTFPLLRRHREEGHEVHLIAVTSPRRLVRPSRWSDALRAAREAVAGNVHLALYSSRYAASGLAACRVSRILRRIAPDVVHARQSRAAICACRDGRFPILLDMRGLRPEEFLMSAGRPEAELAPGQRRELERLRSEDRAAWSLCSAAVCVSRPFRDWLGADRRIHVIPNASEPIDRPSAAERSRRRAELGLAAGERAFVYSGSLASWQCAEETVRLFAAQRARDSRYRLGILTHDSAGGRRLIERIGVDGVLVRTLSPGETRRTLPLFDAAFLLRERNAVNEVAAPVKFGEYLHAGLPVVLTEGIGDASGWVRDHGLGTVLPSPKDAKNASRIEQAAEGWSGERCREFARERLVFERTAAQYRVAYESAIEGARERGAGFGA